MRVLHFITSLHIGGAEIALCNMLEHQSDYTTDGLALLDLHVVYIRAGVLKDSPLNRIKRLGIPTYKLKGFISPYDFVGMWRLIKLVKTIKPDVIHSALWSANLMARFVAWVCKIPLISDLHGDCRYYGLLRNTLGRLGINIPKTFVAVAPTIKQSFKKMYPAKHVVVIQNGIDAKELRDRVKSNPIQREAIGLSKDDFVIGTVGRLHPIKRHDLLIKTFDMFLQSVHIQCPPKLIIIGDGSERSRLEFLIQTNERLKKHVFLLGSKHDAYRYYPLFDCFVLPSDSEGLSIALLEALSFGLPIITTGVSDGFKVHHDIITNGVHGFVVSVNSQNYLMKALCDLYANEKIRNTMSKNNRKLIEDKFQMRHVIDQYINLYKKVLQL